MTCQEEEDIYHDIFTSPASSSSSSSSNSLCEACKFLRRKCMPGCIFAPYFPPEEPQKFAKVHKIFGASNVTKLLNELLPSQREDAVNSLAYEAEARMKDHVYGCVGAISVLQRQVQRLQKELEAANAGLLRYACSDVVIPSSGLPPRCVAHHLSHHEDRVREDSVVDVPSCGATDEMPYSLHQWAAAAAGYNSNAGEGESNAYSAGGDVDQGDGGESNM